jgi:capsular polysaccharide biosynthesis protein
MPTSLLPLTHALRKRLARVPPLRGLEPREPLQLATRSWQLAPGCEAVTPPAVFLPGQLERIRGWAFTHEHPGREMMGGQRVVHGPTRAYLLEDAWLIDGVLYKGAACLHLSPRTSRVPQLRVHTELPQAAIYCSPAGNRWFGQWLMDDCPAYALARDAGVPVTTSRHPGSHAASYEAWLDMHPTVVRRALLRRAVLFSDVGQNRDKHRRFRAMSDKLLSHVKAESHPGVFLVRGRAGERRLLQGELELAMRLQARRGLRILDPLREDVPTIVSACAGARVVVGVEGSALMHGILALRPGAAVLALQPPGRFCGLYKHLTDRDDQRFAFVVGHPVGEDFRVDVGEVERTLDLLPG